MTTAPASAGVIEHIDPQSMDVATNVRTSALESLDSGFLDSIRANGVLEPIVATRDADGLHVRYGQRRTLAAQQVGLPTVPVYVIDVDQDDDAQRIIEQLVENDQRQELTNSDRIQAYKTLELEGLSAAAIAKRTGTKRATIKTGLAVAASDTGSRLVAESGMTLDQVATLLEFEDAPETIANLTEVASSDPGYFPHAVQRARDDRASAQAKEAGEHTEAAKGHRILDESPDWNVAPPYRLYALRTAENERVTDEMIQGKPGVAVHVRGLRDGTTDLTYVIDDPAALGLVVQNDGNQRQNGPMTDEQKAERKTLIANNKEWDASETVRREWLTSFLGRKTLPKDAAKVIAASLTGARHAVSDALGKGNGLAAELMGLDRSGGYYSDAFASYLEAHPTKAGHVTLAIVLGGIESSTGRDTWRSPREYTAEYLRTLAGWGYDLSPVEKIAAKIDTTEEA